MSERTIFLELLLAGFFAVACIRACAPATPKNKFDFGSLLRFPGRVERLRRSRWQWFSMVAIMLVLRVQHQLPPAVEIMVGMMFLIFLVCPVRALVKAAR